MAVDAPAAAATAAAPAGHATKLSTVEGITEYMLPNGMRVLLAPDIVEADHHRQRLPGRQPP